MKKIMKKVAPYTQLILSCLFLFLLILSDFGIVFPTTNVPSQVMTHFAAIFLIISSIIQLHQKRVTNKNCRRNHDE